MTSTVSDRHSFESPARHRYQPEQRVSVDLAFLGKQGLVVGRICGIASAVPGLGTTWIVELESTLPHYPYRCLIVPELALSALREEFYKDTSRTIRERIVNFLSHQSDPVSLSQLHEAMPDLLPGSIDACCHHLGSMGAIQRVTYPRPNGGYICYFSAHSHQRSPDTVR